MILVLVYLLIIKPILLRVVYLEFAEFRTAQSHSFYEINKFGELKKRISHSQYESTQFKGTILYLLLV